jgi:uncharacterized membrane protein YsdA (DUF1294 family)
MSDTVSKLISVNGLLAILFVIVMILRPIAMSMSAKHMEDKDGAEKAMPIYITITILGGLSALIFMFGDKIAALKGKEKLIALAALLISVFLQMGSMGALKAASATSAEYTNAMFDLISMVVVLAILVLLYMRSTKSGSSDAATAASFGHFYY